LVTFQSRPPAEYTSAAVSAFFTIIRPEVTGTSWLAIGAVRTN
jgi:hypothetical protein